MEGPRADESWLAGMRLPDQQATPTWVSWKRLLDTAMCLEAHGLPMYPGMDDSMYFTIDREATAMVAHVLGPICNRDNEEYGCRQTLQLSIGQLTYTLARQLRAAVGCGSEGKGSGGACTGPASRLHLYSGHDSTLFPLLSVLDNP